MNVKTLDSGRPVHTMRFISYDSFVLESFSFKLRMLHDKAMIHSQYIHDAF